MGLERVRIAAKRLIASFAVVVTIACAGTLAYEFWYGNQEAGAATQPASAAPPPAAVAALGRIEPQSEIINLGSGVADRLESLSVRRGDLIKKGQTLGYLQGYTEQVAERDEIAAQLDEAKQRLDAETTIGAAQIEHAQIVQKTITDVTPLKIDAQTQTIASLEAGLANDKDTLASQAQLAQEHVSSHRTYENQKTLVAQEEAGLKAARTQLAILQHQFVLDRMEADDQLRMAQATLARAKAELPIASLEEQLVLAKERMLRRTVYAPIDGRVLNIVAHPGEEVGGDKVILTMGDTSKMRVVAEVYETDIGRVHLGQIATVSSRALKAPLTGRVVEIGDMIFKDDVLNVDPAARVDARVVEVWIELDDPASVAGLTNLTVNVLIHGDGQPVAYVNQNGVAKE